MAMGRTWVDGFGWAPDNGPYCEYAIDDTWNGVKHHVADVVDPFGVKGGYAAMSFGGRTTHGNKHTPLRVCKYCGNLFVDYNDE